MHIICTYIQGGKGYTECYTKIFFYVEIFLLRLSIKFIQNQVTLVRFKPSPYVTQELRDQYL